MERWLLYVPPDRPAGRLPLGLRDFLTLVVEEVGPAIGSVVREFSPGPSDDLEADRSASNRLSDAVEKAGPLGPVSIPIEFETLEQAAAPFYAANWIDVTITCQSPGGLVPIRIEADDSTAWIVEGPAPYAERIARQACDLSKGELVALRQELLS